MKPINIDILSPIHIKDILQESGLILTKNLSLIQKSFLHLLTYYTKHGRGSIKTDLDAMSFMDGLLAT